MANCKHGEMTYREGVSKTSGKAWKGYFCPTPKGTQDQCPPEWIRDGSSPEKKFEASLDKMNAGDTQKIITRTAIAKSFIEGGVKSLTPEQIIEMELWVKWCSEGKVDAPVTNEAPSPTVDDFSQYDV